MTTILIIGSILAVIAIIVEIYNFNKQAMHWWNNLSHYGRYILIERYLDVKENSYLPSKYEIRYLYKLKKTRKQL